MNAIICTSHKLIFELRYFTISWKVFAAKKLGEKQVVLKINSRRNILEFMLPVFGPVYWSDSWLSISRPIRDKPGCVTRYLRRDCCFSLRIQNVLRSVLGNLGFGYLGQTETAGCDLLCCWQTATWTRERTATGISLSLCGWLRRLIAADTTTCWPAHLQRHVLISLNETGRLRPQPSLRNVTSLCL